MCFFYPYVSCQRKYENKVISSNISTEEIVFFRIYYIYGFLNMFIDLLMDFDEQS